jgi:hypothetical protein
MNTRVDRFQIIFPGKGDVIADVVPPVMIEPLKDIKRYVIRPPPPPPPADYFIMNNGKNHPLCREIWMKIFAHLDSRHLRASNHDNCLCIILDDLRVKVTGCRFTTPIK